LAFYLLTGAKKLTLQYHRTPGVYRASIGGNTLQIVRDGSEIQRILRCEGVPGAQSTRSSSHGGPQRREHWEYNDYTRTVWANRGYAVCMLAAQSATAKFTWMPEICGGENAGLAVTW